MMEQDNLHKQLKKGQVASVYLFFGEERLLLNETIERLKKILLPDGLEDFNFDLLPSEKASPKAIVDLANTLPFMAEKRLLLVDAVMLFGTAKDSAKTNDETLLHYLDDPNPQCVLIFKCGDKVDKRKKLYKKVQDSGIVVEFAPLKGIKLEKWIIDYLKNYEKNIDKDALSYLSAMNGFTLEILVNELQKVIDYCGDASTITIQMVRQIITKTVEANIFDLIDAIGNKKGRNALNLLENTLYLGEAPLKILALLVRHFRLLLMMKDLKTKGYTDNEIKDRLKLHPFVVTKGLRQGAGFNEIQLTDFLEKLLLAEVELKSSSTEGGRLLERLIIEFCYGVA